MGKTLFNPNECTVIQYHLDDYGIECTLQHFSGNQCMFYDVTEGFLDYMLTDELEDVLDKPDLDQHLIRYIREYATLPDHVAFEDFKTDEILSDDSQRYHYVKYWSGFPYDMPAYIFDFLTASPTWAIGFELLKESLSTHPICVAAKSSKS